MREIKFRAWDKKRKRMYEVLHLHMATLMNGGIWASAKGRNCIEDKDITIQIQPNDIEVMQYTGLKDKNGKEIYDGDVFKTDHYPLREEDGYLGLVEYDHDRFWGVRIKKAGSTVRGISDGIADGLWEFIDSGIEVIGNIYENPELLGENHE